MDIEHLFIMFHDYHPPSYCYHWDIYSSSSEWERVPSGNEGGVRTVIIIIGYQRCGVKLKFFTPCVCARGKAIGSVIVVVVIVFMDTITKSKDLGT